jgi:hypothetical protein
MIQLGQNGVVIWFDQITIAMDGINNIPGRILAAGTFLMAYMQDANWAVTSSAHISL